MLRSTSKATRRRTFTIAAWAATVLAVAAASATATGMITGGQFTDHAVTQMVVGRATHLDDAHETMTLNPDLRHRWVPHFPGPASRPTVASARCASAVIEQ